MWEVKIAGVRQLASRRRRRRRTGARLAQRALLKYCALGVGGCRRRHSTRASRTPPRSHPSPPTQRTSARLHVERGAAAVYAELVGAARGSGGAGDGPVGRRRREGDGARGEQRGRAHLVRSRCSRALPRLLAAAQPAAHGRHARKRVPVDARPPEPRCAGPHRIFREEQRARPRPRLTDAGEPQALAAWTGGAGLRTFGVVAGDVRRFAPAQRRRRLLESNASGAALPWARLLSMQSRGVRYRRHAGELIASVAERDAMHAAHAGADDGGPPLLFALDAGARSCRSRAPTPACRQAAPMACHGPPRRTAASCAVLGARRADVVGVGARSAGASTRCSRWGCSRARAPCASPAPRSRRCGRATAARSRCPPAPSGRIRSAARRQPAPTSRVRSTPRRTRVRRSSSGCSCLPSRRPPPASTPACSRCTSTAAKQRSASDSPSTNPPPTPRRRRHYLRCSPRCPPRSRRSARSGRSGSRSTPRR